MIEWGDLNVGTTYFLHGGSRADPTRGTEVFCTDTADSLILAKDDYIDIVGLAMLSGHKASQAAPAARPSQAPPKQLRSPSRSPPRTRPRLGVFHGYEETQGDQGDSPTDDEKFHTSSSS